VVIEDLALEVIWGESELTEHVTSLVLRVVCSRSRIAKDGNIRIGSKANAGKRKRARLHRLLRRDCGETSATSITGCRVTRVTGIIANPLAPMMMIPSGGCTFGKGSMTCAAVRNMPVLEMKNPVPWSTFANVRDLFVEPCTPRSGTMAPAACMGAMFSLLQGETFSMWKTIARGIQVRVGRAALPFLS
jgi:hypothetical protein